MARSTGASRARSGVAPGLSPLLTNRPKTPVDWFFAFKFNASEHPGEPSRLPPKGIFDAPGVPKPTYDEDGKKFSRRYLVASSDAPALKLAKHPRCVGSSLSDPVGATFGQVYLAKRPPNFVVWNDQFYNDPMRGGSSPWGHSKGMLAWDDNGEGFVLQVTTPSWPAAGNVAHPRKTDGNTLGFVRDDDIEVSQHFFALKLDRNDVLDVLAALHNSSVHTDPTNPQLVKNGGPAPIQALVKLLGYKQKDTDVLNLPLSSGARLISKPSALHVPPWQLVSSELGGVDLRVACWWAYPKIPSTEHPRTTPICWGDPPLKAKPGAVDIATTGTWPATAPAPNLGLKGGSGATFNHAKFGVSTSGSGRYSIFGDMNQQGTLGGGERPCKSSQNGRGGLFFVLENPTLFESISGLLAGASAPVATAGAGTKAAS